MIVIDLNFGSAYYETSQVIPYEFNENERVPLTKTLTYECKSGFYLPAEVDLNTQADKTVVAICEVR